MSGEHSGRGAPGSGAEHRARGFRRAHASVIWHDVEHGAYDADLALWRELADAEGDPVLDLGAGTGRVAAALAAHGHEVVALDTDAELLAALAARAPAVTTVTADVRDFDLGRRFPLVLAPMQLVQIIGGPSSRAAMLDRVRAHLTDDGLFATALARPLDAVPEGDASPPLPDMLERDGWLFSSQPVAVEARGGQVVVTRSRQAVSPSGDREEEKVEIALDVVGADEFRAEAERAGFTRFELRDIPETEDHIGSRVVLCRR